MTVNRSTASLLLLGVLIAGPGYAQRNGVTAGKEGGATAAPEQKKTPTVNPDASSLNDFRKRVDAYVQVHKKAAGEVPPLKETKDPAAIVAAQTALEAKIRELRADAKAGDIFTPEIRAVFRKLLRPELKGEDGRDAKEVLKDDAPDSVTLKVNAKYPEGAARPTVPASVLSNLPQLPEEVEYRIIDKHLILLDTKAGIIADFIPNAIS